MSALSEAKLQEQRSRAKATQIFFVLIPALLPQMKEDVSPVSWSLSLPAFIYCLLNPIQLIEIQTVSFVNNSHQIYPLVLQSEVLSPSHFIAHLFSLMCSLTDKLLINTGMCIYSLWRLKSELKSKMQFCPNAKVPSIFLHVYLQLYEALPSVQISCSLN